MDLELAIMLGKELNRLGPELLAKHMNAQAAGNQERATMALAQVVFYIKVLEFYQEDDDYYLFLKEMQEVRESQREFYQESRAASNRKLALIALSRLRFLSLLLRRLSAAERDKAMEALSATPDIRLH
jgi:hypothetical protein